MQGFGKTLIAAATIALALLVVMPRPAKAYQIDCAILLCLAGGFPASEPCVRARAEMIRRITPWPIEPPLQLWRCPMRAGLPMSEPREAEVIDALYAPNPSPSPAEDSRGGARLWHAFGEDVTDYVMAIKVYDLTYRRNRNRDGDCVEKGSLRVGTYDRDWNFTWRRAHHSLSPGWLFTPRHTSCIGVSFRGIGMEWRDHEGNQGTEVVRY